MRFSFTIIPVFISFLLCIPAVALSGGEFLTLEWEISDLGNPESVVYDPDNNVLYVSNVNGSPNDKDGNGFISRVSTDGKMLEREWVTGLNAPKGLAITGGRLYTADIDTLVEIDIASARILNRYSVTDAKFLNDVAADSQGRVFVSDMVLNRIHVLNNGEFTIWLESPDLLNPNGLHIKDKDTLIVGSWGVMTDGFATEVPGHLLSVHLNDKSIRNIGDGTPVGNLDGVEEDTDGSFYVTDWMNGKLFRITATGQAELLLRLEQGMADHEFLPDRNMLFIPMMNNNKLLAYRINR